MSSLTSSPQESDKQRPRTELSECLTTSIGTKTE